MRMHGTLHGQSVAYGEYEAPGGRCVGSQDEDMSSYSNSSSLSLQNIYFLRFQEYVLVRVIG